MHGHSHAHGTFVYGCNILESPESTRLYPYILSKINPHFSFESSKFGMQPSKIRTARITLFKELERIPAVYTLESSFYDSIDGTIYTPEILKNMGKDVIRALIPYFEVNVPFAIEYKEKKS